MKKRKNLLLAFAVLVLLFVGTTMLFHGQLTEHLIQKNTNSYDLRKETAETLRHNQTAQADFDFSAVQPVGVQEILTAQLNKETYGMIGGLAIPELSIHLPVFQGMDGNKLLIGAGTLKDGQAMGKGNYALASHHIFGASGQLLFSPLVHAKNGQRIYLTDKAQVFVYAINHVAVIPENQGTVILDDSEKTQITLITCYDEEALYRIVVQGDLVETLPFHQDTAGWFG